MLVLIHILHRTFVVSLTYILIETHRHAQSQVFVGGLAAAGRGLRGQESKGDSVNQTTGTRNRPSRRRTGKIRKRKKKC